MIILIAGTDSVGVRQMASERASTADPEQGNTSVVDGRLATVSDLVSQIGSAGFFATGRVILVLDLLQRAGRGGRDSTESEGSARSSGQLDLAPLFAAVAPGNTLILADPGLASVPAAVKKAAPPDTEFIQLEAPRGEALIKWLRRTAKNAGGEMSAETARSLAARLYPQTWQRAPTNPRYDRPPDTIQLQNEVAKLVAAAHPSPVSVSDIDRLVSAGDDDRIFQFIEAVSHGNVALAMRELEKLRDAGEDVYRLTAQINQQAELAIIMDVADRRDPVSIGKDIGLVNPNRMTSIARGRRGAVSAKAAVNVSTLVDRSSKNGELRTPDDALFALMIGFTVQSDKPDHRH